MLWPQIPDKLDWPGGKAVVQFAPLLSLQRPLSGLLWLAVQLIKRTASRAALVQSAFTLAVQKRGATVTDSHTKRHESRDMAGYVL